MISFIADEWTWGHRHAWPQSITQRFWPPGTQQDMSRDCKFRRALPTAAPSIYLRQRKSDDMWELTTVILDSVDGHWLCPTGVQGFRFGRARARNESPAFLLISPSPVACTLRSA